jgi:uncharacterized protein YggE
MKRLIALLLLDPLPLAAQATENPRTITVDATATGEREPERALLTVAVESQAGTARQASDANADQMTRVIAALRQLRITGPDVRTVSYRLEPVYGNIERPQNDSGPRIVGYRAINMVQIRVDTIARLGPVIDGVTAGGANRVAGLSFALRNDEAARQEALEQAVADARREAEVVARAAGQTLGEPLEISMNTMRPFPQPYADREMMMSARAEPTPVEGGTLTISATVHIVYRLR